MAHKLADELLKDILSPPLLVPEDMFTDTGAVSPFSKATYSAADVLLVCKRWMRVATPALYHTVIIRSLAQAQALAAALTSNPDFGRHVRRLRIEGAYSEHLAKIAPFAPNIVDFCFTLSIWADASTGGLLKLLTAINPERVLITTAPPKIIKNKKHAQVIRQLCSSIPRWTKLRTFHFSTSDTRVRRWQPATEFELYPCISTALAASQSLRSVHLWRMFWTSTLGAVDALAALSTSQTIDSFHISAACPLDAAEIIPRLPEQMRARARAVGPKRVSMADDQQPVLAPNPFYSPMATASPETRTEIWSLILSFALERQPQDWMPRHSKIWFNTQEYGWRTVSALLLVSQSFHAIVVPLLCQHVVVQTRCGFATLQQYMRKHHVPGSSVRSIKVVGTNVDVASLFSLTSNLLSCDVPADSGVLSALGRFAGTTLPELTVSFSPDDCSPFSASALFPFTRLETLHWAADCPPLRHVDEPFLPTEESLQLLRHIDVRTSSADILAWLSIFNLPKLEEVKLGTAHTLDPAFFATHGSKVKKLQAQWAATSNFRSCSALETLEIKDPRGSEMVAAFTAGHPTLREIKLHWYSKISKSKAECGTWERFFETFTREKYPALKEIQLLYREGIWPTNEREIKKSPWPDFAEALAAEGITILDHTGRAWRPRISTRR